MLCDSFEHGFLLAELHHPILGKNTQHHDGGQLYPKKCDRKTAIHIFFRDMLHHDV